ncbi:MAG: hypothetical protein AAFO79_12180, partial [Pseudomonadota bacterium]
AAMVAGGVMLAGQPLPGAHRWSQLARWSYALYLIHFPLIPLALIISHAAVPVPVVREVVFWAVYLGMSLAAAAALYRYVEQPCLAWRAQWLAGTVGGAGRPAASPRRVMPATSGPAAT